VAPTLLSLAGLPPLRELRHGERDLSPLLVPGAQAEVPPGVAYGDLHGSQAYIRTDEHKLLATVAGKRRPQLYDLRRDPGERRNLAFDDKPRAAELWERLSSWRRLWEAQAGYAESAELSADLESQLRALGYLD
jgi:arylsulfatase A-like enzyme